MILWLYWGLGTTILLLINQAPTVLSAEDTLFPSQLSGVLNLCACLSRQEIIASTSFGVLHGAQACGWVLQCCRLQSVLRRKCHAREFCLYQYADFQCANFNITLILASSYPVNNTKACPLCDEPQHLPLMFSTTCCFLSADSGRTRMFLVYSIVTIVARCRMTAWRECQLELHACEVASLVLKREFPKIRGPTIDPKWWGSCCKDTQEMDPNLRKHPNELVQAFHANAVWAWLARKLLASGSTFLNVGQQRYPKHPKTKPAEQVLTKSIHQWRLGIQVRY